MGPENPNPEEILQAAAEIPDLVERARYLEQACGGDAALQAEMKSLLKAHQEAGTFLDSPALDPELTFADSIYVTTRATRSDPWGPPVNLRPTVNTSRVEFPLSVSPDGLVLFFVADRPSGLGGFDTWMTRRPCKGAAWSEPANLGPSFNTSQGDILGSISPDGQWCYLGEWNGAPPGPSSDLWMARSIPPLVSTRMENEP